MLVRALTPDDDLDEAGAIVLRAYRSIPHRPHDPEYDIVISDVRARIDETVVVGAFDGDSLVGCLTFVEGPNGSHAEYDDVGASSFRYFGVDPRIHGRGVGRSMVDWVIAESRRLGKERIFIHTIPVMHSAIRLYESLGFERRSDMDRMWDGVVGWAYVKSL